MDFIPFIDYCNKHIKGDEKGEAQIFLDHFFMALGYPEGVKGAGATLEDRIKNTQKKTTSFADLVWKPRVLIEMKKRDEDLSIHYQQAFSYWQGLQALHDFYIQSTFSQALLQGFLRLMPYVSIKCILKKKRSRSQ